MDVFGHTRSRVMPDHALITPDTHVSAPAAGWQNASETIHISPTMGARFLQYTVDLESGTASKSPGNHIQRFVYVLNGLVSVQFDDASIGKQFANDTLGFGGYAYFPAGCPHCLKAKGNAQLLVFEKNFQPFSQDEVTYPVMGNQADVNAEPFQGDPAALLKTLLPDKPAFDMAINIFTYQPGATLPQVEIHMMEHGLMMLAGAGVYRLGDHYYPVREGDVIWMASFCPQWFVAMGKTPASYIYYKNVYRESLEYE